MACRCEEKIQMGLNDTTGDANVWITCESGTRRSVAAAALLKRIFEEDGYEVPDVVNLSKQGWKSTCGGECNERSLSNSSSKDQILAEETAKIIWQCVKRDEEEKL